MEGTAGSWDAPGRVKTLAIRLEFLEAATGWIVRIDRKVWSSSGSAGISQPLPLHRCSLHQLLVLGSSSILPFSSSIPENAIPTGLELLLEGRTEVWGYLEVERDVGMGLVWSWLRPQTSIV